MTPFAVPSELAAYMQVDVPEATALLHLDTASAAVRTFCNWSVGAEEATWERRVTRSRFFLPTLWLRDVASVSVGGSALSSGDYETEEWGEIRLLRTGSSGLPAKVAVAYSHGYLDTDPWIKTVKGVVLAAASRLVDNPLGNRSETTGGESVTMAGSGSDLITCLAEAEQARLMPIQLPDWFGY